MTSNNFMRVVKFFFKLNGTYPIDAHASFLKKCAYHFVRIFNSLSIFVAIYQFIRGIYLKDELTLLGASVNIMNAGNVLC